MGLSFPREVFARELAGYRPVNARGAQRGTEPHVYQARQGFLFASSALAGQRAALIAATLGRLVLPSGDVADCKHLLTLERAGARASPGCLLLLSPNISPERNMDGE